MIKRYTVLKNNPPESVMSGATNLDGFWEMVEIDSMVVYGKTLSLRVPKKFKADRD
jgi:hypothetical protein